ncbi:MAG: L,D-transpeptidase family protein [Sphingomonadales bacterium]|nr:L,D-transpeptidase family protein [Sphingomonadales bacterium]
MKKSIIFNSVARAILLASALALPASTGAVPRVHTIAELDAPLYYGDYFWDESGAPRARAEIVVDLKEEQIYVYRGGVEIGRAVITRGWENYETPTGTFPILEKDADHYSSTYDNAPMPYNLRLTWKGVAIHGAEVDDESATHGCIGVPLEFARTLFKNVRVGDKVVITRGWMPDAYRGK